MNGSRVARVRGDHTQYAVCTETAFATTLSGLSIEHQSELKSPAADKKKGGGCPKHVEQTALNWFSTRDGRHLKMSPAPGRSKRGRERETGKDRQD